MKQKNLLFVFLLILLGASTNLQAQNCTNPSSIKHFVVQGDPATKNADIQGDGIEPIVEGDCVNSKPVKWGGDPKFNDNSIDYIDGKAYYCFPFEPKQPGKDVYLPLPFDFGTTEDNGIWKILYFAPTTENVVPAEEFWFKIIDTLTNEVFYESQRIEPETNIQIHTVFSDEINGNISNRNLQMQIRAEGSGRAQAVGLEVTWSGCCMTECEIQLENCEPGRTIEKTFKDGKVTFYPNDVTTLACYRPGLLLKLGIDRGEGNTMMTDSLVITYEEYIALLEEFDGKIPLLVCVFLNDVLIRGREYECLNFIKVNNETCEIECPSNQEFNGDCNGLEIPLQGIDLCSNWFIKHVLIKHGNQTLSLTQRPGQNYLFKIGETVVIYWLKDEEGNSKICSYTVTVNPTAGNVSCPIDITVDAENCDGAFVSLPGLVGDDCSDLSVMKVMVNNLWTDHYVGKSVFFEVGTHTVSYKKQTDGTWCSYTVTVIPNDPPLVKLATDNITLKVENFSCGYGCPFVITSNLIANEYITIIEKCGECITTDFHATWVFSNSSNELLEVDTIDLCQLVEFAEVGGLVSKVKVEHAQDIIYQQVNLTISDESFICEECNDGLESGVISGQLYNVDGSLFEEEHTIYSSIRQIESNPDGSYRLENPQLTEQWVMPRGLFRDDAVGVDEDDLNYLIRLLDERRQPTLYEMAVFNIDGNKVLNNRDRKLLEDVVFGNMEYFGTRSIRYASYRFFELADNSFRSQVHLSEGNTQWILIKRGDITPWIHDSNLGFSVVSSASSMAESVYSVSEFQKHLKLAYPDTSEVQTYDNISLYPNPSASDRITIKGVETGTVYRIINLSGQILEFGKLNNTRIDISSLPDQNYVIQFEYPDRIISKQFNKSAQ